MEAAHGRSPSASAHVGLQVKVVGLLLVTALAPLLASALLIGQIGEVAQNFASHEAERLATPLSQAEAIYRDLFASKKALFHAALDQVAGSRDVALGVAMGSDLGPRAALGRAATEVPELLRGQVVGPDGAVLAAFRKPDREGLPAHFHELALERVVPDTADKVRLVFAADDDLQPQYQRIGRLVEDSARIGRVRQSLPRSYRNAFLILLGGVVVVVSFTGIFFARRFTRRIALLVAGTRQVAGGDLEARVGVGGGDELAELASAFNGMVEELERDREEILYLHRIGAWQDVARRLAHEIKNPLTPIQLAVQQLRSSYRGDDARFRATLAEVEEIVGEEIASLRRLVDAFSALGRLPPAEPRPLDLALVTDDLRKDPGLAEALTLEPPATPVTVAGDRLLLRRLLTNLVENGLHAGQAAGRPGKVVLAWSTDGNRARITVDDEGAGVTPDQRERIFEPYVTSKETGTGLGLAISRKIALDHHGDLAVAPVPGPLGGARFVLTLPLA